MSKRRRLFTMILTVVLCIAMAVPVSAGTTYSQRKKASQRIFKAIYYGKYSNNYKFGSEELSEYYDMDINKDGWPERVEYYPGRNLVIAYTCYKNKVRRYVFKDAYPLRYKTQLVIGKTEDDGITYSQIWHFYTIKKGVLKKDAKKSLFNHYWYIGSYNTYSKAYKEISYSRLRKEVNKCKKLAYNSYWSGLFNATRNFG